MAFDPMQSVASPLSAPLHTALATRLHGVLNEAFVQQRLVGAVIHLQIAGGPPLRLAGGFADRESAIAMQPDALFRLASISKPIVATAAMRLVADGTLELDAPVQNILSGFRPRLVDGRQPEIALRQLLSHTAGLGYRFLEADEKGPLARAGVSDGMDASPISLQDNVHRIAQAPLLYPPGTAWGYSLAMDVVGALLEARLRKPLQEIIAETITRPLGMRDTAFHALAPERLTTAYINAVQQPRRMQEGDLAAPFEDTVGIRYSPARALNPGAWASAGAGMVGTAGDLLILLEALRTNQVPGLPAGTVALMARAQPNTEGGPAPGTGFGLGFSVLTDPLAAQSPESLGSWRWGGAYGHSWFVDPVRGISFVCFSNTLYEGMSGAVVNALRDAVYAVLDGASA